MFDALVRSLSFPYIIGFTETHCWRNRERLAGYHLVSQLDRHNTGSSLTKGGGIALYALNGFEHCVAHLADSSIDGRSWYVIHADSGPILLWLWYRRPDLGEIASVQRFDAELALYCHHAVNCIIMGDVNVHNPGWLRFSRRDTPEGTELEAVCC